MPLPMACRGHRKRPIPLDGKRSLHLFFCFFATFRGEANVHMHEALDQALRATLIGTDIRRQLVNRNLFDREMMLSKQ